MFTFMEAHSLAVVVTTSSRDGLVATHLPLVVDRSAGPNGTLIGHFARANSHWRQLAAGPVEALVIYSGPDAYITPAWYQTKIDTAKVVPTWNYIAVHAYGTLRLREDPDFLRAHLESLTDLHEGTRAKPWHMNDAPAEYVEREMKAIVAVSMQIDRLEGKWKMSQNRPDADIAGVIKGLGESTSPEDRFVGEIVSERRPHGH